MPIPRTSLITICGLAALLLAGCERDKDEIRVYTVPKAAPAPDEPFDDPAEGTTRLLAAMFLHGDRTWFVKLMGPSAAVGKQEPTFRQFIASLKFKDDAAERLTWKAPDGWTQRQGATQDRDATFQVGDAKDGLEVVVSHLGANAAMLAPNVIRWRGQLGLRPIGDVLIKKLTREIAAGEVKGTLIDMSGPGGSKPPPAAAVAEEDEPGAAGPQGTLHFAKPQGWKEIPPPNSFQVGVFHLAEGTRTIELSISKLAAGGGGMQANVERWRSQVGLPPFDSRKKDMEAEEKEMAGIKGMILDMTGPEGQSGRQRIRGAILASQENSWFIKMRGPADLVEKHKGAFDTMVNSLRFVTERGGNP